MVQKLATPPFLKHPAPANFPFGLFFPQDGSCNGLQHYAALGRDVVGAASVNLAPCDVPQDVYSGVAQQVKKEQWKGGAEDFHVAGILPPPPSPVKKINYQGAILILSLGQH